MARGTYKVVGGDTLWAIAQANNTTVDKLIELNPRYKDNPNLIRPGQTIVLPTKKGAASNWATDFFDSVKDTPEWKKAVEEAQSRPPNWDPNTYPDLWKADNPKFSGTTWTNTQTGETWSPTDGTRPSDKPPEGGGIVGINPPVEETVAEDFELTDLPIGDYDEAGLLELGAVPQLLADPAYRAFMASFGATSGQADLSMQTAYNRLLGQATRQFGAYAPPEDADRKDALRAGYREGGLYDIEFDKAAERTVDEASGRGMGFSGQIKESLGDLEQERFLTEREFESGLIDLYNEAELEKQKAQNQLIKDKLAEEAAAYERLGIWQAGA